MNSKARAIALEALTGRTSLIKRLTPSGWHVQFRDDAYATVDATGTITGTHKIRVSDRRCAPEYNTSYFPVAVDSLKGDVDQFIVEQAQMIIDVIKTAESAMPRKL